MMLPQSTTEFAPAKINLTLHVTGLRDDGYHLLDSLVAFCGVGDTVAVRRAPDTTLTVTGPFAHHVPPGDDNLVLRAARAFAPGLGLAITLEKNLPVASGLGGGSSDAAALIRAVLRLKDTDDAAEQVVASPEMAAQVLALGADVPVCLGARLARMRGIGEQTEWLHDLPEAHVVLVNPGVAVPTPQVFRALPTKSNPAMPSGLPVWQDADELARWLATMRNDLERPAQDIAPVIGEVLAVLADQPGTLIARMSGSGATCFALFRTAREAAAVATTLGRARPAWWSVSGPLTGAPSGPVS